MKPSRTTQTQMQFCHQYREVSICFCNFALDPVSYCVVRVCADMSVHLV